MTEMPTNHIAQNYAAPLGVFNLVACTKQTERLVAPSRPAAFPSTNMMAGFRGFFESSTQRRRVWGESAFLDDGFNRWAYAGLVKPRFFFSSYRRWAHHRPDAATRSGRVRKKMVPLIKLVHPDLFVEMTGFRGFFKASTRRRRVKITSHLWAFWVACPKETERLVAPSRPAAFRSTNMRTGFRGFFEASTQRRRAWGESAFRDDGFNRWAYAGLVVPRVFFSSYRQWAHQRPDAATRSGGVRKKMVPLIKLVHPNLFAEMAGFRGFFKASTRRRRVKITPHLWAFWVACPKQTERLVAPSRPAAFPSSNMMAGFRGFFEANTQRRRVWGESTFRDDGFNRWAYAGLVVPRVFFSSYQQWAHQRPDAATRSGGVRKKMAPLIKLVHPDLFAQYPANVGSTNSRSLKV